MSSREILRIAIRTIAPPAVMIFILFKLYQKVKDIPIIQDAIITWKVIIKTIFTKEEPTDEEC